MSKMDIFVMRARGPGGQLRDIRFMMRPDDQRSVTSVGCDVLKAQTGIDGWSPVTVDWTNRPKSE